MIQLATTITAQQEQNGENRIEHSRVEVEVLWQTVNKAQAVRQTADTPLTLDQQQRAHVVYSGAEEGDDQLAPPERRGSGSTGQDEVRRRSGEVRRRHGVRRGHVWSGST